MQAEKLQGILLDADYKATESGDSVIVLFFRTRNGIEAVEERPFKPYFYALSENPKKLKKELEGKEFGTEEKAKALSMVEVEKKNSVGVLKLSFKSTHDLTIARHDLKELGIERREYDIPFAKRFLIDNGLEPMSSYEIEFVEENGAKALKKIERLEKEPQIALNILALDIETLSPERFSDAKKDAVIMASLADSKESVVFTTKAALKAKKGVLVFGSEAEMLKAFTEKILEKKPDVLVTYNGDGFDLPYLKERCRELGLKFGIGFGNSEPVWKKKGARDNAARLKAVQHVDAFKLLVLMARLGVVSLIKFDLESVMAALFGEEKSKIKAQRINEIWKTGKGLEELAAYNREDSEAALKIAARYLPIVIELCRIVRQSVFETSRSSASQLVEYLLIAKAFERNELSPNKPEESSVKQRIMATFKGGYVKEPIAGLHENIASVDFKSMHPTIIIAHNVSPETLRCAHKSCMDGKNVSPDKDWFCEKEKGFFPTELKEILDRRMEIKKEMKNARPNSKEFAALDARQQALKILLNSVEYKAPVVLEQNGKIFVEKIGAFIDRNMRGAVKKMESEIKEIDGLRILSFYNNKACFLRVNALIRHRNKEKLYKLILESGREIILTKDHGLLTLENYKIKEVPTRDIAIGTPVVVQKKVARVEKKIGFINILEELSRLKSSELAGLVVFFASKDFRKKSERKARFLVLKALSCGGTKYVKEIAEKTKLLPRTVARHLNQLAQERFAARSSKKDTSRPQKKFFCITKKGLGRLRVEKTFAKKFWYYNWKQYCYFKDIKNEIKLLNENELKKIKVCCKSGGKSYPVTIKSLNAFFKFLGYYVSEGYSRRQKNKKGGHSPQAYLANHDKKILKDMAECTKNAFGYNPKIKKDRVMVNSTIIYLLLRALKAGSIAQEKRVPSMVFSATRKLKTSFFKAYYLGDGHKSFPKVTSVNPDLIADLAYLAGTLGAKDLRIKKDSGVYRLEIRDGLPFFPRPREKLKTYPYTMPKEFAMELLKKTGMWKSLGQEKRKSITLVELEKALEKYQTRFGKDEKYLALKGLSGGHIAFDRVKKIEIVPNKHGWVYDFSVEKSERFFAGLGLLGVHNSHYGYLGYARSRWYSRECARAITAWSRHYIREVLHKAEGAGFKPLYADTDGAFLIIPKSKGQKEVEEFVKKVDKELPEAMELEFEGMFRRGIFVTRKGSEQAAKKRYALIGFDGKLTIVGFEYVRRDWARVAKETQKDVIEAVLKEGKPEKAIQIVRGAISRLKSGNVQKSELVVFTMIQRPLDKYETVGPHTSAALKAVKRGKQIEEGSVIGYIITKNGKSISEKAELEEFVKEGNYDADYYIEHQVIPAVIKILQELGYSKEDLIHGGRQKTLAGF